MPPESRSNRYFLPSGLTLLFLAISLFQSHFKLLWGDEFVTYWVGQQRSFHGIWQALASGADPNPPLMHVLNWASTAAFGCRPEAIRLPSILGEGLGLVSLWILLRRYYPQTIATAGCLALMTTRGFDYTYDARSYGLLLGFALAALAAYDASRHSRRALNLALMALALAAGLSSNYYGVLAFLPIAAAELSQIKTRWNLESDRLESVKQNLAPWLAMALAATPLLAYLPLIHHNLVEFGPHAWNKPDVNMIGESYLILVEGILWPVIILAAYLFWKRHSVATPTALPRPLQVALAILIAYPLFGFAMAYAKGAMISARCVIPVCGGIAILAAVLLARLESRRAVIIAIVFLTVWVTVRQAACAVLLRRQRHAFFQLRNNVERATAPGEQVLVGDSLVVMPLYWYGSPALRQTIVFPIDFDAIHRNESDDSGEQNLWGGRHGVFPVPIDTPAALINDRVEYIYVGPGKGWLGLTLAQQNFTPIEDPNAVPWDDLGGIFTPLAHSATRIYFASPRQHIPIVPDPDRLELIQ